MESLKYGIMFSESKKHISLIVVTPVFGFNPTG